MRILRYFCSPCAEPTERQTNQQGRSGWLSAGSILWPLLVAVLVILPFLTFPPPPRDIGTDGDVSWGAVLSYAHQHDFQFGTQLRYTYGPLGFLIQLYFSPHDYGLRLVTDLMMCYCAAAGLCLVAWRLGIGWRLLLLTWFVFTASNLEGRSDLVLEVALGCWTLLCLAEPGARLRSFAGLLTVLAAFASLAKTSFLFVGVLCIGAVVLDLFLRKRLRLAITLPVAFVSLLVAGWIATGQNLLHLPAFLVQGLAIVRAFNEAMGWEGLSAVGMSGAVLASLTLAILAAKIRSSFPGNQRSRGPRQFVPFVWGVLLLFALWKHSFLRDDYRHSPFFMAFAPVMAIGLGILNGGPAEPTGPALEKKQARTWPSYLFRFWPQTLTIFCCLFSLLILQWLYFATPKHSLQVPFRAAFNNLKTLMNPAGHLRAMNLATEPWRKEAELPKMSRIVGNATADCFGFKQVYLLFNDWNYTPRPVFQSFFACNEQLMSWNEDFYLSAEAPEYVLFSLIGVDRKFPALDDARALRTLLCNYEPATTEKEFLLLRAKGHDQPKLKLLTEGAVRLGQPIDLRPYQGSDLWLQIDAKPSLSGHVRQFFYRAPTIRLGAYREPGKGVLIRRRAPAAMLTAGFVASPLLATTTDVLNLYRGTNIVQPGAYTVELLPGSENWWQPAIRFRIYKIENKLGRGVPADWMED